ncbi:hypothetical protein WA158_000167 [Blastocystis sp. Blastoise]
MESLSQVDDIVAEYLLFRGFTDTYKSFENDRAKDQTKDFNVDKIVDVLFKAIADYDYKSLLSTWKFLDSRFFSFLDIEYLQTVLEYLAQYTEDMMKENAMNNSNNSNNNQDNWSPWFALPFINNPEKDEYFSVYYSKSWCINLRTSITNFFRTIFHNLPMPRLLAFKISHTQTSILNTKLEATNAELLDAKEEYQRLQEDYLNVVKVLNSVNDVIQQRIINPRDAGQTLTQPEIVLSKELNDILNSHPSLKSLGEELEDMPKADEDDHIDMNNYRVIEEPVDISASEELQVTERNTIATYTDAIKRCKWSLAGNLIAAGGEDATLYIYSYNNNIVSPYSTCFSSSDITALTWTKNDAVLYGSSEGCIYLYDPLKKNHLYEIETDLPIITDITANQDLFAASFASDGTLEGSTCLSLYSVSQGKVLSTIVNTAGYRINSISLNESCNQITAGNSDGSVRLYDCNSSSTTPIFTVKPFQGQCTGVTYKGDRTLFTAGTDGFIYEYDTSMMNTPVCIYTSKPANISRVLHTDIVIAYRNPIPSSTGAPPPMFVTASNGYEGISIYKQGVKSHLQTSVSLDNYCSCVDIHPSLPIYITVNTDHQLELFKTSSLSSAVF